MIINIIAWIILGGIAGWIAGMLVKGDERWGVIGHVVLGIVGAVVGGFVVSAILPNSAAGAAASNGDVNIPSIIVAVIGAVVVVWVVNFFMRSRRTV